MSLNLFLFLVWVLIAAYILGKTFREPR